MEQSLVFSNGVSVNMKAQVANNAIHIDCTWNDEKPEYLGPEDMDRYRTGLATLAHQKAMELGRRTGGLVSVNHA